MHDGIHETAGSRVRARLHQQVRVRVALQVVANRERVLLGQFRVYFGGAEDFISRLIYSYRHGEWSQCCRRALSHLFVASEPEQSVLNKRPADCEPFFVLEERGPAAALNGSQHAAGEIARWAATRIIYQALVVEIVRSSQISA